MRTASVRVLVVDDSESWRRFILTKLRKQPNLQVVGEISDGHRAAGRARVRAVVRASLHLIEHVTVENRAPSATIVATFWKEAERAV